MGSGAGISAATTNVLKFTDTQEVKRKIQEELRIKRTYPFSISSYTDLVNFLEPYVESKEKAEQFAKIHFDERGNITDDGVVIFGSFKNDPNHKSIVVVDHGGFLNKKITKGLLALSNGRKFLEPPGIKTWVIDENDPKNSTLAKDAIAFNRFMTISTVLHRAWIIKRLCKAVPFLTQPIQHINSLESFHSEFSVKREIDTN